MTRVSGITSVLILTASLLVVVFSPAGSASPAGRNREKGEIVSRLPGNNFRKTTTRHFLIYSDADAAWTRARAAILERTALQVERAGKRLGIKYIPPEERLVCILFEHYDDYLRYAVQEDGVSSVWVAGYYASRANHIVFYNDEDSPAAREADDVLSDADRQAAEYRQKQLEAARKGRTEEADFYANHYRNLQSQLKEERLRLREVINKTSLAKTVHEATHLLAFNTGLQSRNHDYPFWITEGLATNFETDAAGSAFGPEYDYQPRRERFRELLQNGELLPLRYFVSLSDVPDDSAEMADVMYHQAYALFMYLYRYQRSDLSAFLNDALDPPGGKISPAEQIKYFEDYFGPAEKVEKRWLRYETKNI